jgi:hypothetical protein
MAEQTLNIPQLIVFIIVSVLAIRWYLAKPAAAGTRPATANRAVRINPAHIDQIASMFPQLNRREIAWDLQRNRGYYGAGLEWTGIGCSESPILLHKLCSPSERNLVMVLLIHTTASSVFPTSSCEACPHFPDRCTRRETGTARSNNALQPVVEDRGQLRNNRTR